MIGRQLKKIPEGAAKDFFKLDLYRYVISNTYRRSGSDCGGQIGGQYSGHSNWCPLHMASMKISCTHRNLLTHSHTVTHTHSHTHTYTHVHIRTNTYILTRVSGVMMLFCLFYMTGTIWQLVLAAILRNYDAYKKVWSYSYPPHMKFQVQMSKQISLTSGFFGHLWLRTVTIFRIFGNGLMMTKVFIAPFLAFKLWFWSQYRYFFLILSRLVHTM